MNTRYLNLSSIEEANTLAANLYGTEENCEGTEEECFIAGWTNAHDCIEEGGSKDWETFREIMLDPLRNVHP